VWTDRRNRFAFEEAAVRDTELLAVIVFDDLDYRGFAKGANLIGRLDDDEEHAVLAEQLASWCGRYPDVPVRRVVLRGRPAEALLGYAKDRPAVHHPRLLVVGSLGRGGLAGLLLGSTSQRLITHTRVPVVVVPPGSGQ
jgi:nucleotide-binding universal stress UspA family protein